MRPLYAGSGPSRADPAADGAGDLYRCAHSKPRHLPDGFGRHQSRIGSTPRRAPTTHISASAGPQDTTIWLGGIGQFLNLNSSGDGPPGYSGSSGGLVAGIDGTPRPEVRIGTAIAFSSQSINTTNSATYSGNAVQLQIYGSARHDVAFLDVQAGAVFTEGTARRIVSAYGVAPNGDISGSGGGGFSFRGGVRVEVDGWNLEPSVLLGGLALSQGGVTETKGRSGWAARGKQQHRQPPIADWHPGGSPCSGWRDLSDCAVGAGRLGL